MFVIKNMIKHKNKMILYKPQQIKINKNKFTTISSYIKTWRISIKFYFYYKSYVNACSVINKLNWICVGSIVHFKIKSRKLFY